MSYSIREFPYRRGEKMKLKYNLSFQVVCALSLISVFFFQGAKAQELNQNFGIETLAGDHRILDEIAFSAVINEGSNLFSRVTLSSGEPQIEPIIYDLVHGLDEQQLEHRELYRNAIRADIIETEDYTFSNLFNYEYIWKPRYEPSARLAILDHNSDEVKVINHTFVEIKPQMSVWNTYILEDNGEFYYVVPTDNSELLIYRLDIESLALEFMFMEEFSVGEWIDWFILDNHLYGQVYTNTGVESYVFNFDTRELDEFNFAEKDFSYNVVKRESQIFFHEYFENSTIPTVQAFNTESETVIELENPSFIKEINDDDWPYLGTYMIGDYLVLDYRVHLTHFIGIYELDSLELIYEGKINLRRDQGLMTYSSGQIKGFEPTLRD